MSYKFLAVEGNIGAGKTTLANFIHQKVESNLLLENFEDNPFLKDFYQDKKTYAFDTEIFFLKDRIKQLQSFSMDRHLISDFTLFKSKIFSGINLNKADFKLFEEQFNSHLEKTRLPNVIIFLDSPIENLQKNIEKRGRIYENQMDPNYLDQINREYQKELGSLDDIPIIRIPLKKIIFPLDEGQMAQIIDLALGAEHKGVMDLSDLL